MKFRASQLSKIMTMPKNKSEKISETAKTYLKELWIENNFNRRKEITSKYLEKGTLCEEESMTLYTEVSGNFYKKNEVTYENDYIIGTPDIEYNETIIDLKTSWDIWTFSDSEMTKQYEWQLISYMWLKKYKKAKLVYCLIDTPQHLIVDEQRKWAWRNGIFNYEGKEFMDACEKIEAQMTYSDIPKEARIKEFNLIFDDSITTFMIERINAANEYYNLITKL